MSCYVCLSDITRAAVQCANESCEESVCKECFRNYVEFSNKSFSIPYCSCESTFRYTTIVRECSEEEVDKYNQIIKNKATLSVENFDEHLAEKDGILANFRTERAQFIKTLPKGFAFVLNVSMKSKIKKLEQGMLKKMELTIRKKTPCKKLLCPGILEGDERCTVCSAVFCAECELEKKDDAHVCNPDDLETVKFVKQIIECPKCRVKITKSYGCNSITCSICKTNFNFVTGERSYMGSDRPQHLEIKSKKLTDIITEPKFKELLDALVSQEPKQFKLTRNDLNKSPSELGKLFVKQCESVKKTKAYFALIRKIEKDYAEKKLTEDALRSAAIRHKGKNESRRLTL